MERKHNRGIGMSHKSILSRIRGPIQTSYADNIMSSKQTAIFTWSIPQGGLPKVILKEYYYFKEKNSSAFILSLNPIPNAYFNDFAKVGSEHCIVADHNLTSKIINISDFLPGLEVSMRGSLLRNVIALIHHLRIRNPSVIIAHQLLSAYLLMPYCLIYRKPYVVVLHDNPFMFIEEKNLKKMSIIRRFQATLVYLFSNIVILPSITMLAAPRHRDNTTGQP